MNRCGPAVLLAALLAACGTPRPGLPPPPPPLPDPGLPLAQDLSPAQRFEHQQLARTHELHAQGRLAEAAQGWEILLALRPGDAGYAQQLAATRRQIDAAVQRALQRGAQLQKSGDSEAAAAQYLEALALQPEQADAADRLRAIERERVRRGIALRTARLNALPAPQVAAAAPGPAAPIADRSELEHAAILAALGETEAAIALLERRLAVVKSDPAACRQLAELYQRKPPAPRRRSAACPAPR